MTFKIISAITIFKTQYLGKYAYANQNAITVEYKITCRSAISLF